MAFDFHSGWSFDDQKIAASVERMTESGQIVSPYMAIPSIRGLWKKMQARGFTRVLAQDDELKVLGHHRDTNSQARGTCVWQGSSRACEDVHISAIADRRVPGRYALLSGEAGYAWCRLHFGWGASHQWGCRCGNCPDGLVGANYAEFAATMGLIERGVYAGVDLTTPREDLAINWGNKGGIPQQILDSGLKHKFSAHKAANLDEYADGMANKNWGANCLSVICSGGIVDADGYCTPDGRGGHCTENCGITLDPVGEDAFQFQQSWPLGAVKYPAEVKTKSGIINPRPGSYFIRRSVLEKYLRESELWLFDVSSANSFRSAA